MAARKRNIAKMSDDQIRHEIELAQGALEIKPALMTQPQLEEYQRYYMNRIDECKAELNKRSGICEFEIRRNTSLECAAQDIIGEMEMNALLLSRDTGVEVIRCTRFDDSTYLTTRKRVLAHA
jgi:hypothetical protein